MFTILHHRKLKDICCKFSYLYWAGIDIIYIPMNVTVHRCMVGLFSKIPVACMQTTINVQCSMTTDWVWPTKLNQLSHGIGNWDVCACLLFIFMHGWLFVVRWHVCCDIVHMLSHNAMYREMFQFSTPGLLAVNNGRSLHIEHIRYFNHLQPLRFIAVSQCFIANNRGSYQRDWTLLKTLYFKRVPPKFTTPQSSVLAL